MKNSQTIFFFVLLNLLQYQLSAMTPSQAPLFGIGYGSATATGTRHPDNEDRHFVYPKNEVNEPSLVAAIFDGHGGSDASEYLYRNFLYTLDDCDCHADSKRAAVRNAFELADERLKSIQKQGACALVVIIKNGNLLVAHAGDSRAVIYRNDGQERSFIATLDHKPNSLFEKKRIEEAGGQVVLFKMAHRVYGNTLLSVSRSIGDYREAGTKDLGLTFEPSILERKIDASYKFIILASDGVWDVLSSEEAIYETDKILSIGSPEKAAKRLIALARERKATDDLTAIVIRITILQ